MIVTRSRRSHHASLAWRDDWGEDWRREYRGKPIRNGMACESEEMHLHTLDALLSTTQCALHAHSHLSLHGSGRLSDDALNVGARGEAGGCGRSPSSSPSAVRPPLSLGLSASSPAARRGLCIGCSTSPGPFIPLPSVDAEVSTSSAGDHLSALLLPSLTPTRRLSLPLLLLPLLLHPSPLLPSHLTAACRHISHALRLRPLSRHLQRADRLLSSASSSPLLLSSSASSSPSTSSPTSSSSSPCRSCPCFIFTSEPGTTANAGAIPCRCECGCVARSGCSRLSVPLSPLRRCSAVLPSLPSPLFLLFLPSPLPR